MKRFFCIFLATAMALSLLTGCGRSSVRQNNTGTSSRLGASGRAAAADLTPRSAGSLYITDGGEYDLAQGDYMTLYFARTPTSTYYAYNWYADDEGEYIELDPSEGTCMVTALKPGTVEMDVYLTYSVDLGFSWEHYEYHYTITINVVEKTGFNDPHYGSVTDGSCPRCNGHKTVDCTVCYGDGDLWGNGSCSNCSGGSVTCPTCDGSGSWS